MPIAQRIKKKFFFKIFEYGNITNQLQTQNKDWLSSTSRRFLMVPTTKWLQIVLYIEEEFQTFPVNDWSSDEKINEHFKSLIFQNR